jgi:hypothetical protein
MVYSPGSPPPGALPPDRQSSKGIAIPSTHLPSLSEAVAHCGCRCGGCSCSSCFTHGFTLMRDSNCESYKGQGAGINTHSLELSNVNPSSLEAKQPTNVVIVPPSFEILGKLHEHTTPAQLAEARTQQYVEDVDDEAPWLHYLSPERSPISDATELSGMIFPIDDEGSMENHPASSISISISHSMLSSYASAMSVRSDAASAVVRHTGAALSAAWPSTESQRNPFLQLL